MPHRAAAPLLLAVVAACLLAANLAAQPTRAAVAEPVVFKPRPLDADTELVNPLRGLYRWNDQEVAPQPRPTYDSYQRYAWRDLEPAPGVYDFAALERDLAEAERAGRKHGFRVRAMVKERGMIVPDHIADTMERGWWSRDTYIPDWNDPDFLDAVERFIRALGERYDGDPRISYVEIGMYGNYGEWHMWPFVDGYPTAKGAQDISSANARRIVDAYIAAFPTTRLMMMSDYEEVLVYALQQSPQIGWRRDSLGVPHFAKGIEKLKDDPAAWALVSERWKTAPVITEFISPDSVSAPAVYELAFEQARTFRVAMLGNGNTLDWDRLSARSREAFLRLGRALGYRYELSELELPAELTPGATFEVRSSWRNLGLTPTYEAWEVLLQLRAPGSDEVAWEGALNMELGALLPAEPTEQAAAGVAAQAVLPAHGPGVAASNTQLRIDRALTPGSYEVALIVRDPAGYRAPLALAIEGRAADGSYPLGTVRVARSTQLGALPGSQIYLPVVGS